MSFDGPFILNYISLILQISSDCNKVLIICSWLWLISSFELYYTITPWLANEWMNRADGGYSIQVAWMLKKNVKLCVTLFRLAHRFINIIITIIIYIPPNATFITSPIFGLLKLMITPFVHTTDLFNDFLKN